MPDKPERLHLITVQNHDLIKALAAAVQDSSVRHSYSAPVLQPTIPLTSIESPLHVHPHGWWRGGTVYQRYKDRQDMDQTIVNETVAGVATGVDGEVLLFTVPAGERFFMTYLSIMGNQGVANWQIRDSLDNTGSIVNTMLNSGSNALNTPIEGNPVPWVYNTGVFFDSATAADISLTVNLAGFTERLDIFQ